MKAPDSLGGRDSRRDIHPDTHPDSAMTPPARRSADLSVRAAAGCDRGLDLARLSTAIEAAVAVVAAAGTRVERLHVELVDDAAMDAYHRRHSGVEGTTDVLTFPGSGEGEPIDVDIIACVDEARRRAAEFGHPIERELLLYALHGLLHCMGHDDHDPDAYERMHAEEDRILTAIGVGATFRPSPRPDSEGARS